MLQLKPIKSWLSYKDMHLISSPTQVKINWYKSLFFLLWITAQQHGLHILYACSNINKIVATQRRSARFVLNDYFKYSSVTNTLNRRSWQLLQICRSSLKLMYMFDKIVNEIVDIPSRH